MFRDYYEILGVNPEEDDSTKVEERFRELAKKHHPDKNPDDATATSKMQDLLEAREILTDPEKRKAYDKQQGKSHPRRKPAESTPRQPDKQKEKSKPALVGEIYNKEGKIQKKDATFGKHLDLKI